VKKPTSIGQIKAFVKKRSGRAITEWLGEIYRSGYRQGYFDSSAKQYEENNSDIESTESPEEQTVDGSDTVD